MSIDWITVAAQIVNFLVLVWLLRRFLYRPILDGIDAREREIAERMAEAATIREAAEAAEAEYRAETAALRASRAETLDDARAAAGVERDALIASARQRLAREEADRIEQRAEERRRFAAELHQDGAAALLALTRKVLADLSDETLEQRIVSHTTTKLGPAVDDLRRASGGAKEIIVTTREPLPADTRAVLDRDLAAALPGLSVRYRNDATQAPGLTVRLGGAEIAWTVQSYLDGLDALLADRARGQAPKGLTDAA
jgi:F-type H+-transporting ATPase subunit b